MSRRPSAGGGGNTQIAMLRANLRGAGKRLWAAGAAVAISVAFIVTGLLLVGSFTSVITEEAEADAAGADLILGTGTLADPGEYGTDDDGNEIWIEPETPEHEDGVLAEAISELDSVASVETVQSGYLEVAQDDQTYLGFMAETLPTTRPLELASGRLPTGDDEMLISCAVTDFYHLNQGDTVSAARLDWGETGDVTVLSQEDYTVVGVVEDSSDDVAYLTPAGMERLPTVAQPAELRVVLEEELHGDRQAQERMQEQILQLIADLDARGELTYLFRDQPDEELVPEEAGQGVQLIGGVSVATRGQIVDQWVAQKTGDARTLQYIAFGFGAIAIFVSALVIANTFQVIVAARLRTMALIRAVGGTAGQLRTATLAEGAVLGLIGGAAGIMLGWAVTQAIVVIMRLIDGGDGIPPGVPSALVIGLGLGLGLVMALGSALYPALKAGRVSPMEALRPADLAPPAQRVSRVRLILGSLLTGSGLVTVLYSARAKPDTQRPEYSYEPVNYDALTGLPLPVLGILGGFLAFGGMLVLARIVIPPLAALLGAAVSRIPALRVPAKLAGQNARQVPGRTTATASALLVGVTLVVMMTVGAATAQKVLYDELNESYPVDGITSAVTPEELAQLTDTSIVTEAVTVPGASATTELGEEVTILVVDEQQLDTLARHSPVTPEPGTVLVSWGMATAGFDDDGDPVPMTLSAADEGSPFTAEVEFASWLPVNAAVVSPGTLPSSWEVSEDQGRSLLRLSDDVRESQINELFGDAEIQVEDLNFEGGYMKRPRFDAASF
ncbi:ABC transporter permease [Nesterenkonia flava]|uniref:ABC transporter permease n=1 Tax=Nesterenkonia flava TaxID=469799 RepID=A0ABU1FW21_9MICC|nr:ABC transporter permease [Nesterenkonia flava]MDR5712808.1 ABC transporter permease [Nesterenkonia flava]